MASDRELEQLREALKAAREKLQQQDEMLARLSEAAFSYSTIVDEGKDDNGVKYLIVNAGGNYARVAYPQNIKVKPGDTVAVVPMTGQIYAIEKRAMAGSIATVTTVIDSTFSEISGDADSGKVVFNGRVKDLKVGDRVVMDQSGNVILRVLPREKSAYVRDQGTGVNWDMIGGIADAKAQMIETVEWPLKHPEIYEFYGKKPPKGVLLYGPPGCGKTMLGKAAATALAEEGHGGGFLYIKAPEILDKYVGVSEARVRELFAQAREYHARTGQKAVLFIDEADAIMGRRGTEQQSVLGLTLVPSFLTEMDGLDESGALVILATNRPDALDPAIVRDGRIDRKIRVGRPDREATATIFKLNLEGVPLANRYTIDDLADDAAATLFDPTRVIFHVRTDRGALDLTMAHIINGAMVAGVVEKASSRALRRDLLEGAMIGVRRQDVLDAIADVQASARDLDVRNDILDLMGDSDATIQSITRPKLAA